MMAKLSKLAKILIEKGETYALLYLNIAMLPFQHKDLGADETEEFQDIPLYVDFFGLPGVTNCIQFVLVICSII